MDYGGVVSSTTHSVFERLADNAVESLIGIVDETCKVTNDEKV